MGIRITDLFDDYSIQYWTSGKNVTHGWVNVRCPFCMDTFNHLGINPKSIGVTCWKCGKKGIVETISVLIGVNKAEAYDLIQTYISNETGPYKQDLNGRKKVSKVKLPPLHKRPSILHLNYLKKRGFEPLDIFLKYQLKSCTHLGEYCFRIFVPIFYNGRMVSFTTAAVKKGAMAKYKHNSKNNSIMYPKDTLYNIDSVQDSMLIVEGLIDVWKIGDGAVCTFGSLATKKQILQAIHRKPKNVFVLYDSEAEAQTEADKIARNLSGYINHVEVLELDNHNDPGELTLEEARKLRKELKL